MRALIIGCCALCAGGGLFMGVGNRGIDYDGNVAQVRAELVAMPVPKELRDSVEESSGSVRTDSSTPGQVSWHFYIEGHELGQVTATLTPADADTTNVQVEWDPGDALPKGSNARAVAMQPLVEQVAETFVAEQIDATLEDRPFNKRAVAVQLAAYATTHPKEMRQYMAKVQALAEEGAVERPSQIKDRKPPEWRQEEARFKPGQPMITAKPMNDLSKYNRDSAY